MTKYYKLLTQLEQLGVDLSSPTNASRGAVIEDNYLIGSIPAESENLHNIQHDIIFNSIEKHWSMYNKSYYQQGYDEHLYNGLHELIETFDFKNNNTRKLFKKMKHISKRKNRDYLKRIIEDYNEYMADIIDELETRLDDIEQGFLVVTSNGNLEYP